jgi:SAM-dependent methyltransferase
MKMKTLYGRDFASAYNEKWAFWGARMWPFLSRAVTRNNPRAKTWLDLCCGTGSLLRIVSENGFIAAGIDVSKHQITHARRNAPNAKLMVRDIRELSLGRKFDVITCMFDSLNYLTRKNDLLKVFCKVKSCLSEGGLFAFDMNTFEGLQDIWCRTSVTHEPNLTLVTETSFNPGNAMGRCLITGFVRKGRRYRRFQEEHIERGYTRHEINCLLAKAGFSFRTYDGLSFGSPRKRSARLLYVCRGTAVFS